MKSFSSTIRLFDSDKIILALWLFLLIFPKGGFKIGGVPLTWGYLVLGMLSAAIPLIRSHYKLNSSRFLSYLALIPFQAISLAHLALNGSEAGSGMTISFLINFFFLPYTFFLLLSQNIDSMNLDRFYSLFKKGILFISLYGIFLFVFKHTTGRFIEIPFLTTNWSDLGELDGKCINRGFAFKLISTYNNGNLYGICLLILLPLYCYLEKSSWKKSVVKASLLLTLSRTVWIGLVFNELCYALFIGKRKNGIRLFVSMGMLALSTALMSLYFDFALLNFIFDPNLGGRTDQLAFFQELDLFSSNPFGGISEIVYAGVIHSFGILGLIAFLIAMTGPLAARWMRSPIPKIHLSLCLGIANYLLISCSDGGMLYIPVMAFYWFNASLLCREDLNLSSAPSSSRSALSPVASALF